jgi:hypothetical protein
VSGPVVFFLALDQGTSFAAGAAHGSLMGAAGQTGFCLGYAWSGRAGGWPVALAGGALGFAAGALALAAGVRLPVGPLAAILACCVALTLALMPATSVAAVPVSLGRCDIPWHMATGLVVVLALTRAAPLLGADGHARGVPGGHGGAGGIRAARPWSTACDRGAARPAARDVVVRGVLRGAGADAPCAPASSADSRRRVALHSSRRR